MKWNLALWIVILGSLMVSMSCDREDDDNSNSNVLVRVIPVYKDNPIKTYSFDDKYEYMDNQELVFTKISMYLSNIQISNADGPVNLSTPLDDVLKFTYEAEFSDISMSNEGLSMYLGDLPDGDYTMRLGLGLDSSTNGTKPADYDVDHVLGAGAQYWDSWQSYVYTKHEGRHFNTATMDTTDFVYHTGGNECYNEVELDFSISGENDELELSFDFFKIFQDQNDGSLHDVPSQPRLHSINEKDLANWFCENLAQSAKLSEYNR